MRRNLVARNSFFAFAHKVFELPPVRAGTRRDALRYLPARSVRRDAAEAGEGAARARVDVFNGEVIGARAPLQFRSQPTRAT